MVDPNLFPAPSAPESGYSYFAVPTGGVYLFLISKNPICTARVLVQQHTGKWD